MRGYSGFVRTLAVLFCGLTGSAQTATDSARIDRLVELAKLWAAVKYFHPYLAYRDDIDWDGALVRAIPKVNAARDHMGYAAAVQGLLNELGDPVTRVREVPAAANPSSSAERQPTYIKNADGVLIVAMTNYSDFQDHNVTREKLGALKKELPNARSIVFDLRPSKTPSESERGWASNTFALSGLAGALTSVEVDLPGERRRMHMGYAPQLASTSGDYGSGFYIQGRQPIKPEAAKKDVPVVFLIGPNADLPPVALGLQASGIGAIVVEGSAGEEGAISTQTVELRYGVQARIRLGELVYADGSSGFLPNLTVAASTVKGERNPALQAAIQLAMTGKFSPPSRAKLVNRTASLRDNAYADMQYPPAEFRVLAAFRIWAVINYFFPYQELMQEDWNAILRQFIPRMEDARDALEYNLAIAEMVTHIHDSHGGIRSPVLQKYFGDGGSAPVRVRMIEGSPVITAFTNPEAAKKGGLEIGDVILKVDGEEASHRLARRLKYTAHSTLQAGMYVAADRGVVWGPKDSTETLTIRDVLDQVREVQVARKAEYLPLTWGDRTGDVLRLLPGNIGYTDLDRLPLSRVDEMFEQFKDCPAIIFDGRGYPQGTAWTIAPRLTEKTGVVAAMIRRLDPMSPDLPNGEIFSSRVVKTFFQRLPPTGKWRYHGRTVMLIDERTISQAEHTGLFFEAANGTVFIGSPTEGANGDVTNLSVPGGIYIGFSGQGIWHADGRQLQRTGLQPAVEAKPTLAGIRAGKDEVLDKALEYLRNSIK